MAFTDEDVKRFKRLGKTKVCCTWTPAAMRDLLALLARLEAAEVALKHFTPNGWSTPQCQADVKAWRKAAGREYGRPEAGGGTDCK